MSWIWFPKQVGVLHSLVDIKLCHRGKKPSLSPLASNLHVLQSFLRFSALLLALYSHWCCTHIGGPSVIFSKSRVLTSMSQDLSDGSKMGSEASVTAIDESPAKASSANSDSRLLTIPTEVRESILKCLLCSPEPLCRVKRNPLVRPPLIPGDSQQLHRPANRPYIRTMMAQLDN